MMKRSLWTAASLTGVVMALLAAASFSLIARDGSDTDSKNDMTPMPASERAGESGWCGEHRVPESVCTQCNPDLIDQFKATGDWCPPHDLPESHCRLCNPEIEFPRDWCGEHYVPESVCTQCNPDLIDQFKATGDWCPPHDLPESHCRLCNPEIEFPQELIIKQQSLELAEGEIQVSLFFRPNASVCATNGALIQFASAITAERAGITVQTVRQARREEFREAPAEIVFDETHTTVVTSTVPAMIARWHVSPGDVVHAGEVLATVQSPNMVELQADLLADHAAFLVQEKEMIRHDKLRARDLSTDSAYESNVALTERARAKLASARGMLLTTGILSEDVDLLIETGAVSSEFALRSPGHGQVMNRVAQVGELLEAGRAFVLLADPSAMWIEARLAEEQIRNVSVGQSLSFTSDGIGLNRVGGKVIWVSRFLDPHTRTGTVRAVVDGSPHQLRAGEFGHVTIVEEHGTPVTLIPKDAVQWEGCCNVVFVREADDRYRPRKVELAAGNGPYYQVTEGLQAGEQVVVGGAFLLKTELKKSSIGAGCCDFDPAG